MKLNKKTQISYLLLFAIKCEQQNYNYRQHNSLYGKIDTENQRQKKPEDEFGFF